MPELGNGVPDTTGSDPDGAAAAAAAQAAQAQGGMQGAPAGSEGAQGGSAAPEWDGKIESLPAGVQKMISDLRAENKDRRTTLSDAEQKQADLLSTFAKLIGMEQPEGGKPDPDAVTTELTTKLAARDAELRELKVDTALNAAIAAEKASPLTAAVLKGTGVLNDLDPGAEGFATKLSELVKETVQKNPELKGARIAGSGGPDLTGSSNRVASATTPGMGTLRAAFDVA
jgi:hypothetical protein